MTKLTYWQQMVKEIQVDAQNVLSDHRNIYKNYVEIINSSRPEARTPFDFHDFVRRQHGSAVAMFIRRQTDTNNVSLYRLLHDLEKNNEEVTLDWFKLLYGEQSARAEDDFKRFTQDGVHLSSSVPKKDRLTLLDLGEKIKNYVDTRLAHRSQKEPLTVTYNDLDTFLDAFEEILKRYLLLLEGSGYVSITPVLMSDWGKVFRYPWFIDPYQE
jgi:hypothetical protein